MIIPKNLSTRLAKASTIATQIINTLNTCKDSYDVLLCGSSLNPQNRKPRDMDFAVILPMTCDFAATSARLRNMFPTARIDYGKHYKKPSELSPERLHLWVLTAGDVSTDQRIQRTLRSGQLFDRSSSKWRQPIL